jgi:hypothetical protein
LAAEQNAAEHGQTTSQEALPELQAALDALPPSHALIFERTEYGQAFASAAAFGSASARWWRAKRFEARSRAMTARRGTIAATG